MKIEIPVGMAGMGAADETSAQTLWSIINGDAYDTMKSQQRQLMEQGADIQSALNSATGDDVQKLNDAWNYNQQAKNAWAQQKDAYNTVVNSLRTWGRLVGYNPPSLSGMGILPLAIPAIVYEALTVAAIATAVYTFYAVSSNVPKLIDTANNILSTVQTGINRTPDIIGAGADALTKVAVIAGVGFAAYTAFGWAKKKGHI